MSCLLHAPAPALPELAPIRCGPLEALSGQPSLTGLLPPPMGGLLMLLLLVAEELVPAPVAEASPADEPPMPSIPSGVRERCAYTKHLE